MTDSISFPYTVRSYPTVLGGPIWAVMHDGVPVAFYSSEVMAIKAAAHFTLTVLEAKESN